MDFVSAHKGLLPKNQTLIETAESTAENIIRRGKNILPYAAKGCIVSTFLEDGVRMYFQFPEQRDYFNHVWRCGYMIASLLVLLNMFGQLIPCVFLLLDKYRRESTYVLFAGVIIQGIIYKVIFNIQYLMKGAAVLGGLVLLLASYKMESKNTMFASLPTLESTFSNPKSIMQLGGRILLVLMFLTLFVSEHEWNSILTWLRLVIGLVLILGILAGYKTSLAGLSAAVWLMINNMIHNRFWAYASHSHMHDYYKFDFFQTMSVVGGLLLLVSVGPGGASFDEQKKKW